MEGKASDTIGTTNADGTVHIAPHAMSYARHTDEDVRKNVPGTLNLRRSTCTTPRGLQPSWKKITPPSMKAKVAPRRDVIKTTIPFFPQHFQLPNARRLKQFPARRGVGLGVRVPVLGCPWQNFSSAHARRNH